MARTRGPSVQRQLLIKSREAALNAVQTFNNPLTVFKAETFIVLMIIAWTYLLHAYYRREGVEYRYHEQGLKRRKFVKTKSGAFKYWELGSCLNEKMCPLDGAAKQNLKFLIGLRNEIEHHMPAGSEDYFSSRYLACCLNYERYLCELFGDKYSLGSMAAFTLQFRDFTNADKVTLLEVRTPLPSNVAKYVQEFDAELSEEEYSSPSFRCRFLFTPLITNKKAQADEVIQSVPYNSELGKELLGKYQQVLIKEAERPKHIPTKVVVLMNEAGFEKFGISNHTKLWQELDGKNPGKGYGIELAGRWYWYDRWVDEVREHCIANIEMYADHPERVTQM